MSQNLVGIIGFPLHYTLSPIMHNAAFKALGLDNWRYEAMPIPPDIPRHAIEEPRRHGFIGLNVTIPFKETSLRYIKPDEKARAIGAVNTVDFRTDIGTNTDVDGFIGDLQAHHVPLANEKVIVLGAGGAARAAVYGLWQSGAQVAIVNRTTERAQEMLTQLTFSAGVRQAHVMSLEEASQWGASLVINCTSVGTVPNVEQSAWDERVPFPKGVIAYDMVYRPSITRFMQQAEQAGGRAIGGLGMLVRQGAKSFELWTGQPAPLAVMFEAVREALMTEGKG